MYVRNLVCYMIYGVLSRSMNKSLRGVCCCVVLLFYCGLCSLFVRLFCLHGNKCPCVNMWTNQKRVESMGWEHHVGKSNIGGWQERSLKNSPIRGPKQINERAVLTHAGNDVRWWRWTSTAMYMIILNSTTTTPQRRQTQQRHQQQQQHNNNSKFTTNTAATTSTTSTPIPPAPDSLNAHIRPIGARIIPWCT